MKTEYLSIHLYRLYFFLDFLQFPACKFLISWVKFIKNYFIPFNDILNVIIFLISFLYYLLLVNRNASDFFSFFFFFCCMLIVYPPAILSNLFVFKILVVFRLFYIKHHVIFI